MSADVVTVPDAQHHADCQMVYPQLPLVYGHTPQDCIDLLPKTPNAPTTTMPPVPTTACWAAIPPRGDCTGTNPYVNGAYPSTPPTTTTPPTTAPQPSTSVDAPPSTTATDRAPQALTGPPRTIHTLPATGTGVSPGGLGGGLLALGLLLVCLTRRRAHARAS